MDKLRTSDHTTIVTRLLERDVVLVGNAPLDTIFLSRQDFPDGVVVVFINSGAHVYDDLNARGFLRNAHCMRFVGKGTPAPLERKPLVEITFLEASCPVAYRWLAYSHWSFFYSNEARRAPARSPWDEPISECARFCQSSPLTGVLAAWYLAHMPINSLTITGFDFYRKRDGSFPRMVGGHRIPENMETLRELAYRRPRVRFTEGLDLILCEDDHDFDGRVVSQEEFFTRLGEL